MYGHISCLPTHFENTFHNYDNSSVQWGLGGTRRNPDTQYVIPQYQRWLMPSDFSGTTITSPGHGLKNNYMLLFHIPPSDHFAWLYGTYSLRMFSNTLRANNPVFVRNATADTFEITHTHEAKYVAQGGSAGSISSVNFGTPTSLDFQGYPTISFTLWYEIDMIGLDNSQDGRRGCETRWGAEGSPGGDLEISGSDIANDSWGLQSDGTINTTTNPIGYYKNWWPSGTLAGANTYW